MTDDSNAKTSMLKEHWQVLTLLIFATVVMVAILAIYLPFVSTYAAWCAERGGELSTYYPSPGCNIPE